MRSLPIFIILAGALIWIIVYSLSQSGLNQSIPTKFRLFVSGKKEDQLQTKVTEYSLHTEQERRQRVLKNTCSRLKLTDLLPTNDQQFLRNIRSSVLFFSDKFKFVACLLPKVGCTNFKRVMLVEHGLKSAAEAEKLDGDAVTNIALKHFRLNTLENSTEIRSRLKNYYKFMMVREPMHRILSAFRNKIEPNTTTKFFKDFSKKMIKFSSHGTVEEKNAAPSFEQFLRYITVASNKIDHHWKLYHKLCFPCAIEYDFIAKMETVGDDMNYVMNRVGMKNMTYPARYPQPTDEERVTKYYQSIPTDLIRAVYATFKDDFELFEYSMTDILKPNDT